MDRLIYEKNILLKELKGCFDFFNNEINLDENSNGYGLIRDQYPSSPEICSIASVGFGLASLITGVKNNWISSEEANKRAILTLKTFLNNLEEIEGFYYHFVNMNNGLRELNSEISIIDTGIFICGAITAGEFFGGEVQELADKLYRRINWTWFVDKNKDMFYMSYTKEKGFEGYWDVYAEQLMLYILGVGSPTHGIDKSIYYTFNRLKGNYGEYKDIIHSWFGSLFTYQYSHAFIDFRNTLDKDGINWWDNSVKATLANRQYCIDNQDRFKSFNEYSWGITACITPNGYFGLLGAKPSSNNQNVDGTISPSGAIGSIVFTPTESITALTNYYLILDLIDKYGLKDSYNLDYNWFATESLGIDKGISMVMIQNFLNESIWNSFMKNKYVKNGMDIIGFTKAK